MCQSFPKVINYNYIDKTCPNHKYTHGSPFSLFFIEVQWYLAKESF